MNTIRCLAVMLSLLLLSAAGCERPPVPERTEATGPPKVVTVHPKSEQAKELVQAVKESQANWVTREEAAPLPSVNPAAAAPAVPAATPPAAAAPVAPVAPPPMAPVSPAPADPSAPTPTPAAPAPAPATAPATTPAVQGTAAAPATSPPTGAATAPAGPGPGSQVVPANRFGLRGNQYGPFGYALSAKRSAESNLKAAQVLQQLQVFAVTNDRPPRDLEEFKEKILKPLQMDLPTLPDGQAYFFDPNEKPHGELKIWQSQPAP